MNVCEVCFLFQMIWLLGTEFRGGHSEFLRENLPTPSVPESRSRGSVHSHSCRAVVLLGHAAGGGPPGTHSLSCAGARGNPSGTCSTHNCWVPVLRMWCSYRGGPSSIPRVYPLPCSLQPPSKGKNPLLFVVCPHREDLTRGPKGGRGLFPSPTRSGDVGSRRAVLRPPRGQDCGCNSRPAEAALFTRGAFQRDCAQSLSILPCLCLLTSPP